VKKLLESFVLVEGYRKSTTRTSWGTTDDMKEHLLEELILLPTTTLNLWVCTMEVASGYAQFPGGASSTDGVAIDSKYIGSTGTAISFQLRQDCAQ
jgi:hypothetical protein